MSNTEVEKTTQRGALKSVLLIQYFSGDQFEKNVMAVHVARMGEIRVV
jgi:hypothetical protein